MARYFTKLVYTADMNEITQIMRGYKENTQFIKYNYVRDDRYIDFVNGVVYCSDDGLNLDYKSTIYYARNNVSYLAIDKPENHWYDDSKNCVFANIVVLTTNNTDKTFEIGIQAYPIIQDTGKFKIYPVEDLFDIKTKEDILSIKDIDKCPKKDELVSHFEMLEHVYTKKNLSKIFNYLENSEMWDYLPDYSTLLLYASEKYGHSEGNFFDCRNIPEDFHIFLSDGYISSYHLSYALINSLDYENNRSICNYYADFPNNECRAAFINGLEEKRYFLHDFTDLKKHDPSNNFEKYLSQYPEFFIELCDTFAQSKYYGMLFDTFCYYVDEFNKENLEPHVYNISYLKYCKYAKLINVSIDELSKYLSNMRDKENVKALIDKMNAVN